MGLAKLKTLFAAKYVLLLAKLGAIWGPIAQAAITIIGATVGIPTILDVAVAVWDAVMQKKGGIRFDLKKTWFGLPYGFDIYAD